MIKTPHWPVPLGHKPIALGLERIQKLLERLGNPQERMPPTIHIAGTNGKGSTLATIKAILEAAGYRVHRYTSPHLVYFNERIELAGSPIADDYLYKVLETCRQKTEDILITFFEGTTAAALLAFAETPADIVLLETGLGGRLDATNVLANPALTIITPIGFDHMDFLGDSLAKIAAEKAAIMRRGVPCVVAPQPPEAMEIIQTYATYVGAPLYHAERATLPCPPALAGEHQLTNAKVAVMAIDLLSSFKITEAHIISGLRNVTWPARLQQLNINGREVWLDGGHNAAAGEALAAWAKDRAPITLICGMLKRKELAQFLAPLQPYISQLIAVPIPDSDGFAPEEIAAVAHSVGIASTTAASVPEALQTTNHESQTTLIAGSLYLAGSVLAERA